MNSRPKFWPTQFMYFYSVEHLQSTRVQSIKICSTHCLLLPKSFLLKSHPLQSVPPPIVFGGVCPCLTFRPRDIFVTQRKVFETFHEVFERQCNSFERLVTPVKMYITLLWHINAHKITAVLSFSSHFKLPNCWVKPSFSMSQLILNLSKIYIVPVFELMGWTKISIATSTIFLLTHNLSLLSLGFLSYFVSIHNRTHV